MRAGINYLRPQNGILGFHVIRQLCNHSAKQRNQGDVAEPMRDDAAFFVLTGRRMFLPVMCQLLLQVIRANIRRTRFIYDEKFGKRMRRCSFPLRDAVAPHSSVKCHRDIITLKVLEIKYDKKTNYD